MKWIVLLTLFVSGAAWAQCASTVSEARQNGLYNHLLKLTGQRTWMTLTRRTDGKSFSGGVSGNSFKVAGYSVRICKQGANGISAEAGFIKGYIHRRRSNGRTAYVVSGLGSSYNGVYDIR